MTSHVSAALQPAYHWSRSRAVVGRPVLDELADTVPYGPGHRQERRTSIADDGLASNRSHQKTPTAPPASYFISSERPACSPSSRGGPCLDLDPPWPCRERLQTDNSGLMRAPSVNLSRSSHRLTDQHRTQAPLSDTQWPRPAAKDFPRTGWTAALVYGSRGSSPSSAPGRHYVGHLTGPPQGVQQEVQQ